MADETAAPLEGERLRSAFAISDRHVLTAWHCVKEFLTGDAAPWFRLRIDAIEGRRYIYIPVRVTNYDVNFDAAVLALDLRRLADVDLTIPEARSILSEAIIPLATEVRVNDIVQVMGFPLSGVGADSDTNQATVVDIALPLGDVTGLKLTGTAFGAVSPIDPHGISGGPVIKAPHAAADHPHAVIAVVRAVPRGTVRGAASGASLIASRIADMAESLPEVGMVVAASATAAPTPRHADERNVLVAFRECSRALRESVVAFRDPDLGTLTGWAHFLEESLTKQRPTAVGTAYGLKLALVLGEEDGRLDLSALAETLWKLRRADGGWAARTGRGIGRPEVGALVLGALASAGFDAGRLADAVATVEDELSPDADPVGLERTYVVSAAMRGLTRAHPGPKVLPTLRRTLLEGAIQDPSKDNLLCWASRLSSEDGRPLIPSVAHTAIAVASLARTDRVLGTTGASHMAIDQALRWLVARHDLKNQTEQIRRVATSDSMTIGHFAAAWVARALLAVLPTEIPGTDGLLDEAVGRVWESYGSGAWEWEDGQRPIWMAYQGACVLRDYAMCTLTHS